VIMGQLVKMHNGELVIAENFVATPEYTLIVADYSNGSVPPYGWEYYTNATAEQFILPWKAPLDVSAAYPLDAIVFHNDISWRCTLQGNLMEPSSDDTSGWIDLSVLVPLWKQPLGAHDAYALNAIVYHEGKYWQNLVPANVWEPGVANWRETGMVAPGDSSTPPPEWVQPTGAGDAYPLGAVVTHNSFIWSSTVQDNVWEPGVYGWSKVTR